MWFSNAMIESTRKMAVPSVWVGPINEWVSLLKVKGLSTKSISLYTAHLHQLARGISMSPLQVKSKDLIDWCARRSWASETRRSAYSVYKQFFGHLHFKTPDEDPSVFLKKPPSRVREPRPTPCGVLTAALSVAEPRTKLMLILGSTLGLRIGEIVRVHVDDVEFEVDGPVLRVLGKGNKRRSVPLTDSWPKNLSLGVKSMEGGHSQANAADT